jgi:hypothetical protein
MSPQKGRRKRPTPPEAIHRSLNPILVKNFSQIFAFRRQMDVYRCSIQAKSASVVTKWSHEFSKNFDVWQPVE